MVVSIKDSVKLAGISVICFCAVFVCTFFINYCVDAAAVADSVTQEMSALYQGQLATAKFSCALSGGCLSLIAFVMLVFYIKLYIDGHGRQLGILKAMGYKNGEIALKFWVFGFGVLIGSALGCGAGYAAMPMIYSQMTVEGLTIPVKFHFWLPIAMIALPTLVFSALSCGYARFALGRDVGSMLKGEVKKSKALSDKKLSEQNKASKTEKPRAFLLDMGIKTLSSKKMLVFFIAFASFCFSAMAQMGGSMYDLNAAAMGPIILAIGLVLAVTVMLIAFTALFNANTKNLAIMKAFGYSARECAVTIFTGYIPFAFIGFGVGTAYQYAILRVMVNLFFKEYSLIFDFDVAIFFITLAAFTVFYAAVMLFYFLKIKQISVKAVMAEN